MGLFVGLMSGTSLDGVDAVLAQFDDRPRLQRTLAFVHCSMPGPLRVELLGLNSPGADELHRAALATNALMTLYADAVRRLLAQAGVAASSVHALGAHGQTVRHRPRQFDGHGYTLQLVNGALLAELTDIDTLCDFRSADVAAGGQGAPLVPAFHADSFRVEGATVAVLNIGGIANLTLLPAQGPVTGFDCGPGNVLLDLWTRKAWSQDYDVDGARAAAGTVQRSLLASLLAEPYLALQPPKSTGRDLFHQEWLAQRLPTAAAIADQDVLATLAELTVRACTEAMRQHAPDCSTLLVCGGGAFNRHLMRRLATLLPRVSVTSTADRGVPPDQVEALAFAWLAARRTAGLPGNVPSATGARGPRLLGAWYPAPRSVRP